MKATRRACIESILMSISALVAAIFMVMSFMSVSGSLRDDAEIGADSESARPSSGVESEHMIEFPDRIRFDLRVDSSDDVESIRLFYTVGSNPVSVYSRPLSVDSAGGNLRANFVIHTSGDGFIPQGVDIEYYYAFTDSRGVDIESERFRFEYLDPRYEWQRLEMDDFTLFWHDRPRKRVEEVAAAASASLLSVRSVFGVDTDTQFAAVAVNSRREANSAFPPISQTSQDISLYGGFAFDDYGVAVMSGMDSALLTHELTHLMLDEALDSPRAVVPAWLNEGLAMYFEPGDYFRELSGRRALHLRHMTAVPGKPEDVRLFYEQSASVVRFMLEQYGEAKMSELLSAINDGHGIDAALTSAYGFDVEGLDSEWRVQMSDRAYTGAAVDFGALGSSAIVSGAVLVACCAVVVRWLRSRANA